MMATISEQLYDRLQLAINHFNKTLFGNQLPEVILTMQRQPRTMGYLSEKRWINTKGDTCDELALNPEYFANRPLLELLQTIVHEQCHLWQAHFGKPSRAGYHNQQWANKMESIGLMPSHTGAPGGKRTGQHMNDHPIAGGHFLKASKKLVKKKQFTLPWVDRFAQPASADPDHALGDVDELLTLTLSDLVPEAITVKQPTKAKGMSKFKYSCPGCSNNLWAKPGMNVMCVDCEKVFVRS